MSGPNFASMSFQELRAYEMPNKTVMSPLKSPEDTDNYPEFMEHLRKSSERYRNKKA